MTVTDINKKLVTLSATDTQIWDAKQIVVCYDEAPAVVNVTGVNLNKTSTELTVGGNETLTVAVLPDNATDKTVTWSSSDESVATVDNNGTVTAVGGGMATINSRKFIEIYVEISSRFCYNLFVSLCSRAGVKNPRWQADT